MATLKPGKEIQLKLGIENSVLLIRMSNANITNQIVDGMVNTTDRHLTHKYGVSNDLLNAGGTKFAKDCEKYINKYGSLEMYDSPASTRGGDLTATHVIHCLCPSFTDDCNCDRDMAQSMLEVVYSTCFEKAKSLNLKSIAFPGLGTGKCLTPAHVSGAAVGTCIVDMYRSHNFGSLEDIRFVDTGFQIAKSLSEEIQKAVLGALDLNTVKVEVSEKPLTLNLNVASGGVQSGSNAKRKSGAVGKSKEIKAKTPEKENLSFASDSEEIVGQDSDSVHSTDSMEDSSGGTGGTARNANGTNGIKSKTSFGFLTRKTRSGTKAVEKAKKPKSDEATSGEKTKKPKSEEATSSGDNNLHSDDDDKHCSVCMCEYTETPEMKVETLHKCGHKFHNDCIQKTFAKMQPQCPICKTFYGVPKGNMPENGHMQSRVVRGSLPGFNECKDHIQITYSFPSGTQTNEHSRPGVPYSGTHRTAYLPNTLQGQLALELLQLAWKHRLTFTVADSVTSGAQNTVVWNNIHHKTSPHGGEHQYGYPDALYLNRLEQELASVGITRALLPASVQKKYLSISS